LTATARVIGAINIAITIIIDLILTALKRVLGTRHLSGDLDAHHPTLFIFSVDFTVSIIVKTVIAEVISIFSVQADRDESALTATKVLTVRESIIIIVDAITTPSVGEFSTTAKLGDLLTFTIATVVVAIIIVVFAILAELKGVLELIKWINRDIDTAERGLL